jgi:proline dehydrogenase
MSRNAWLREHLPRLGFARRAVRRFMPGEQPEDALRAAAAFKQEGIASEFTRLGENVTSVAEADEVATHYLGMVERIAAAGLDGEISVKLTQLGLDLDQGRAQAHVERLIDRAALHRATVWIDMEGSAYTERTIALFEHVRTTRDGVGLCLQAYLRRTASDIERLLPLGPTLRLVKGAYAESAAIAYQRKGEVDRSYVALATTLLHAQRADPRVRIGLGTHDVRLIEQIATVAGSIGLPKSAFEVQMLYGIRADQQRRLAREGYPVRDLIGYGTAWYAWYMRRLAERPANVAFALRQLLP